MDSIISRTQMLLTDYLTASKFENYLYFLIPQTAQQIVEFIKQKLPQETINIENIKVPEMVVKVYNDIKNQQYNNTDEVQYQIEKSSLILSTKFIHNYTTLKYNKKQHFAYNSFLNTPYSEISNQSSYTNYDLMSLNINQNNEYSNLYSKGYSQKVPQ